MGRMVLTAGTQQRAQRRHRQGHHDEAYCLIWYESANGEEREQVYNNRDLAAPAVITLRSGTPAHHVYWTDPEYRPNFRPPVGSRMLVDLTPDRARWHAERIAKFAFAHRTNPRAPDPAAHWDSEADMARHLVSDFMARHDAADIIEVV